jgi:hypothetical protein
MEKIKNKENFATLKSMYEEAVINGSSFHAMNVLRNCGGHYECVNKKVWVENNKQIWLTVSEGGNDETGFCYYHSVRLEIYRGAFSETNTPIFRLKKKISDTQAVNIKINETGFNSIDLNYIFNLLKLKKISWGNLNYKDFLLS